MDTQGKPCDISVIFTSDGSEAFVVIPQDFPRENMTVAYCKQRYLDAGGDLTISATGAIKELIESAPPLGTEVKYLVARKQEPVHGCNGSIQWFVEEESKKPATVEVAVHGEIAASGSMKEEAFSFYNCSAYTMVKTDQVIGKLTPPTAGVDGRDVKGRTLAAKSGKPYPIKFDDSILCASDGRLIAQREGVLQRTQQKAKISPRLVVPEYVDFSTGNIDFTGDVVVQRGVRDCFVITATGNVEVLGLIEAATIKCGSTLAARGGMAGRERGQVTIGGHLIAKYLDNVGGEIKGDLIVDREVINCNLIIGGSVRMARSAVIGGKLIVTGDAEIGTIGSPANPMTHLVFGSVPLLETKLKQLNDIIRKMTHQKQLLIEEQSHLQSKHGSLSSVQKERMTEVMFEIHQSQANIEKANAALSTISEEVSKRRTVKFTVLRRLHENTRLTICDQQFRVNKDVAGPLVLGLSERGEPVYQQGTADPRPLSIIACQQS